MTESWGPVEGAGAAPVPTGSTAVVLARAARHLLQPRATRHIMARRVGGGQLTTSRPSGAAMRVQCGSAADGPERP